MEEILEEEDENKKKGKKLEEKKYNFFEVLWTSVQEQGGPEQFTNYFSRDYKTQGIALNDFLNMLQGISRKFDPIKTQEWITSLGVAEGDLVPLNKLKQVLELISDNQETLKYKLIEITQSTEYFYNKNLEILRQTGRNPLRFLKQRFIEDPEQPEEIKQLYQNSNTMKKAVQIFRSQEFRRLEWRLKKFKYQWVRQIHLKLKLFQIALKDFIREVSHSSTSSNSNAKIDSRKLGDYLTKKLKINKLEQESFRLFLLQQSDETLRDLVSRELEENLLNYINLQGKYATREDTMNLDYYFQFVEIAKNDPVDLRGCEAYLRRLGLKLNPQETEYLLFEVGLSQDYQVEFEAFKEKIRLKDSAQIQKKFLEFRMKKQFVLDVKKLLRKQNQLFEQYFVQHLQRGEIYTDKFRAQLVDLQYDFEQNQQVYDFIVYELTEDTEEISYKRLSELFNSFEDPEETGPSSGKDLSRLSYGEPRAILALYDQIKGNMRNKKQTFRKVFATLSAEVLARLEAQNISAESLEEMQRAGFLDFVTLRAIIEENKLLPPQQTDQLIKFYLQKNLKRIETQYLLQKIQSEDEKVILDEIRAKPTIEELPKRMLVDSRKKFDKSLEELLRSIKQTCIKKQINILVFGQEIDEEQEGFCNHKTYFKNLRAPGGLLLNQDEINLLRVETNSKKSRDQGSMLFDYIQFSCLVMRPDPGDEDTGEQFSQEIRQQLNALLERSLSRLSQYLQKVQKFSEFGTTPSTSRERLNESQTLNRG